MSPRIRIVYLVLFASLAVACGHPQPAWSPTVAAAALEIAPTTDDETRELPLHGVRNGRELGGINGVHGPVPRDHFFRTATLAGATEEDKKVLLDHEVTLDIDLRTSFEVLKSPDALAHDPRFHYEHISLFGFGLVDLLSSSQLGNLYVAALARHPAQFRTVFHAIATAPEGAVLFHCTSGKDRTGLIAAFLLSLAGADRATIVHNYALSAHYLHPAAKDHEAVAEAIRASPPDAIEQFLDALAAQGGAEGYLRKIGVSDDDLNALRARLGQ